MTSLVPRAGFVQFRIAPGEPGVNLDRVRGLCRDCPPVEGGLLILPELWGYGFVYHRFPELAHETSGLLEGLTALADEFGCVFGGSLLERDQETGDFYNTLFFVGGKGVLGTWRKMHLFRLWEEDRYLAPGSRPAPVLIGGSPVGALVCYDLRFPELAREQVFAGAGLLVVSAQWPRVRLDHWRILLRARAVENQVFVVAANGCGQVGHHELAGHSMIIAPDGEVLAESGESGVVTVLDLDQGRLEIIRSRFCSVGERPWLHRDRDKLVTPETIEDRLAPIRDQGSRIVLASGRFTELTPELVTSLEEARCQGDLLLVVPEPGSPDLSRQGWLLASLGCVDFVVLGFAESRRDLLRLVRPDVQVSLGE
ncbi:nitrilase-related carbon-nitrogen hydrolase [Desulfolithobacter sp.]